MPYAYPCPRTHMHTHSFYISLCVYTRTYPCIDYFCSDSQFWFAGDSGYCDAFKTIGEKHGPIDLSAIPIGAYSPRSLFRRVHMNPEEAIRTHLDARSVMSVAMHHSTFQISAEATLEPAQRLRRAVNHAPGKVNFIVLPNGGSVTV